MSESQFLDNLLIRVFSILQNSIIKFLNESYLHLEENKNQNQDEEKTENKNNIAHGNKKKKIVNLKSIPVGLQGVISLFIWVSKSLFMRSEIKNFKKSFSWQEMFSKFSFSLLTESLSTVFKNYEKFKLNDDENSISLLSENLSEEQSLISGMFGEKMSIITSYHSYIFLTKNLNNNYEFLYSISPIWSQRTFCRLALPLLKFLREGNNYNDNNNNDNSNNNNNNSNNNINSNDKNINTNNNNTNNNSNKNSNETSGALLGLINLTKNMPSIILSPHTTLLTNIIIQTLHSTSKYDKIDLEISGNIYRILYFSLKCGLDML